MSDDLTERDDEEPGEEHSLAEWALETFVYAPTGLVLTAFEDMPELVAKGRARIELQLRNAHFLGRFVVDHGRRDLDRRLGRTESESEPAAAPDEPYVPPASEVSPVGPRAVPPLGGFAPAPADLAIPDYDTLSASQVVRRLDGLGHKELEAVYRHEAATRGRRTIIYRAQQLLGSEEPPGR
ncbi:MAG: hypothetical protein ACLP62_15715 [Acidimicrobiales bacterium]